MTDYSTIDFTPLAGPRRRRGRHALVRARHPPALAARCSRSSRSTTAATTPGRTRSAPATLHRAARRPSTSWRRAPPPARSHAVGDHRQAVHPRRRRRPVEGRARSPTRRRAQMIAQLGHHVARQARRARRAVVRVRQRPRPRRRPRDRACNADYRTVDASAPAIALPEVFLGLIPGWGGAYLLPNLIGIENALKVVIENPLKQNRMLKGPAGVRPRHRRRDLPRRRTTSRTRIRWADGVLSGRVKVEAHERAGQDRARSSSGTIAIGIAAKMLKSRIGTVPQSPYAALDLLEGRQERHEGRGLRRARTRRSPTSSPATSSRRPSTRSTSCRSARSDRPARPTRRSPRRSRRSASSAPASWPASSRCCSCAACRCPCVITDLDQARVDKGVAYIHDEIDKLAGEGPHRRRRGEPPAARSSRHDRQGRLRRLRLGHRGRLRGARRQAGRLRRDRADHLADEADARDEHLVAVGRADRREARAPRAARRLPLLQPGRGDAADRGREDAAHRRRDALDGSWSRRRACGKNAVHHRRHPRVRGQPPARQGLGEAMRAVDEGTPFVTVDEGDRAARPADGAVRSCSTWSGWKVAAHVLDTHHARVPRPVLRSENLHRLAELRQASSRRTTRAGSRAGQGAPRRSLQGGIGSPRRRGRDPRQRAGRPRRRDPDHARRGRGPAVEDIDLCLILGAGWPFRSAARSPYLDRVGASERVFGDTFHHPRDQGHRRRSRRRTALRRMPEGRSRRCGAAAASAGVAIDAMPRPCARRQTRGCGRVSSASVSAGAARDAGCVVPSTCATTSCAILLRA